MIAPSPNATIRLDRQISLSHMLSLVSLNLFRLKAISHWGTFLVITSPDWSTSTALSPTADPVFRALVEQLNEVPIAPVQPLTL